MEHERRNNTRLDDIVDLLEEVSSNADVIAATVEGIYSNCTTLRQYCKEVSAIPISTVDFIARDIQRFAAITEEYRRKIYDDIIHSVSALDDLKKYLS